MSKKGKNRSLEQAKIYWNRFRRNKTAMAGLVIFTLLVLAAICAPLITPQGIDEQNIANRFLAPGGEFLLGTDNYGRDIYSRIVYGARISLMVGVVSTAISALVGITLGAVAGFYGGVIDNIIMRILDCLMAVPQILLAIAIAASLGPGLMNAVLAVAISNVPKMARVTRAPVMSLRGREYIEAAQSIRASKVRIIFRHILPNALAPIIVAVTFSVAHAIIAVASLSFLGLGAQAPSPEWGTMLSSGRQYIRDYWWVTTFPGVAIMISVFSLNLIGDGLRDVLDPKLKN